MNARSWWRGFKTLVVGVSALIWLAPVAAAVFVALKSRSEFATGFLWSPPDGIALWENALRAWESARLGEFFGNSILYATAGSLGAMILASLAAYAISVLRVRGGFLIFMFIYSGTVFPFQIYLIPLFQMFLNTGLYDSRLGLILVYTAIAVPFSLFVFTGYFRSLPREIYEAARIDGCNRFDIYRRIVMPMSTGAVAVVLLFQFTWIWNDLMFGLILSSRVRPVMVALSGMLGTYGGTDLPALMAAALLASLPTAVLFVALQRFFFEGLALQTAGE